MVGNNDCSAGDKGNVIEQIQSEKAGSVDVLLEEVCPVQFGDEQIQPVIRGDDDCLVKDKGNMNVRIQPVTADGGDCAAHNTGNEDNHIKSAGAGDKDDSAKDIRNREKEIDLLAANVKNLKKGNSQDAVEPLKKVSKF